MFERFSDEGRRVVVYAQDEAVNQLHQSEISTAHLVLGVLRLNSSDLGNLLTGAGATLEACRNSLSGVRPRPRKAASGHIPFSLDAGTVLQTSLQTCDQLGDRLVSPIHLMIAILGSRHDGAVEMLTGLGVDVTRLAQQIRDLTPRPVGNGNRGQATGWIGPTTELARHCRALADGLLRYGAHDSPCDPATGCTCGFETLTTLARSVPGVVAPD